MEISFREIPVLLRTRLGRRRLVVHTFKSMWPLTMRLAYGYRSTLARRTRLVAVIGSYGKTTTARATAIALGLSADLQPGNSGAYVADALLRVPPFSQRAVLEVGIDGKEQMERHSKMLRPDVVVVTSIGSEHHRTFGTTDVTRSEKVKMLKDLPASALAVLNVDDLNVRWMKSQTRARILAYGTCEACDVSASDVKFDLVKGTSFMLHFEGDTRKVKTKLVGKHFVYSVLAALAVALAEGFGMDEILLRLEKLNPVPGRMQPVCLPNGAIILRDEFKSSLETIDVALDVMEEIEAKRKFVVLGEVSEPPGSQGPIYRRLGERVAKIADFAIFLGGNFQRYSAGAKRAGFPKESIVNAKRDVQKVIKLLRSELRGGDVVLIKGRDTQRLDRIGLALSGKNVTCERATCRAIGRCQVCPELDT